MVLSFLNRSVIFAVAFIACISGCGGGGGGSSSSTSNESDSSFTRSIAEQMTVENCSICHGFKNHDWAGCGDPVWENDHKAVIICPVFAPEESSDDPVYDEDPSTPDGDPGSTNPNAPRKPKKSAPPSNSTCTLCHAYKGEPDCSNSSWKQQSPGHSAACASTPPPKKKKKNNQKSLSSWNDVKDLALFLNGGQ